MMNFGLERMNSKIWAENHSIQVLAGATTAIFTYTVPCRAQAEILEFGNYTDTVAAWGLIYWYVTQNGFNVTAHFAGVWGIYDQIGYAAQRQAISPYVFGGGSILTVYGVNGTAGNIDMGFSAKIREWYDT